MSEPGEGEKSVSAGVTSGPSKATLLQKSQVPGEGPSPLEKMESIDKFAIDDLEAASIQDEIARSPSWSVMSCKERTCLIVVIILKVVLVLLFLYLFVCSLKLLTTGFKIIGGPQPQKLLHSGVLDNPVVGLMCGVLITLLVQSSSTTTTAIVGMVSGKIIDVRVAIPIVMGANIGTSVTNTLLAMMQVGDRNRFRLAFAAATIHDIFNFLTTVVLLPLESVTGYLYHVSGFLVKELVREQKHKDYKKPKFIGTITDPLVDLIVKLDKDVAHAWTSPNATVLRSVQGKSAIKKSGHMFAKSGWSDTVIGIVVTLLAFVFLITCLILMVHTLKSILKGKIALWIRKASLSKLPYCPALTDYLLILMGALLTFLVQSSSVFTSLLPPLVSVKALSIERAYCLTLGANIGTTTTAIIAAAAEGNPDGFRIALCHLIFNFTGVLLFFPLPIMRWPIKWAKGLGNITAQYRWFAVVYIIALFILMPLLFMGLAFAGSAYVIAVAVILAVFTLFVVVINSMRKYKRCMPEFLQTWNWLPIWFRSLEPYDKIFTKCKCCKRLIRLEKDAEELEKRKPPDKQSNADIPQETSKHNEETLHGRDEGGVKVNPNGEVTEYVHLQTK